jgi:hypothetical protein
MKQLKKLGTWLLIATLAAFCFYVAVMSIVEFATGK